MGRHWSCAFVTFSFPLVNNTYHLVLLDCDFLDSGCYTNTLVTLSAISPDQLPVICLIVFNKSTIMLYGHAVTLNSVYQAMRWTSLLHNWNLIRGSTTIDQLGVEKDNYPLFLYRLSQRFIQQIRKPWQSWCRGENSKHKWHSLSIYMLCTEEFGLDITTYPITLLPEETYTMYHIFETILTGPISKTCISRTTHLQ